MLAAGWGAPPSTAGGFGVRRRQPVQRGGVHRARADRPERLSAGGRGAAAQIRLRRTGPRTPTASCCACCDYGLSLAQSRWVIDQRTDLAGRAGARHDDDVLRAYERACNEWQRRVASDRRRVRQATGRAYRAAPARCTAAGSRAVLRASGAAVRWTAPIEVMARSPVGTDVWTSGSTPTRAACGCRATEPIEAEIVRLLGNRYRPTHTSNVTDHHQAPAGHRARSPTSRWPSSSTCRTGWSQWETGAILPHDPAYLSTVQLPVEYVPSATCPQFEKYLARGAAAGADRLRLHLGADRLHDVLGQPAAHRGPAARQGPQRQGHADTGAQGAARASTTCSSVTLHELTENKFRAATSIGKLANLAGDLDAKWLDNTAHVQEDHRRTTRAGRVQVRCHVRLHAVGAAVLLGQQGVRLGRQLARAGWPAGWWCRSRTASSAARIATLDAKLHLRGGAARHPRQGVAALPALMARGNFADLDVAREAKQAFVVASDAVRAWIDECCVMDPTAWTPPSSPLPGISVAGRNDGANFVRTRVL